MTVVQCYKIVEIVRFEKKPIWRSISATHLFSNLGISCTYELGVKTIPNIGVLFAFDNFENLRKFMHLNGWEGRDSKVLIGTGMISDIQPPFISGSRNEIVQFWDTIKNPDITQEELEETLSLLPVILGTLFLDWFIPTDIVSKRTGKVLKRGSKTR